MAATLAWIPQLHWIVVEDSEYRTDRITRLLDRSRVKSFTHLWITSGDKKGRGIAQRNLGLSWIRYQHRNTSTANIPDRVVYFADDDNSYDERLFEYIRSVQYVGVWPVALVGGSKVESPKLDENTGKIVDWYATWKPSRLFHVDMAGFAVSLKLLLYHDTAHFHKNCQKFITLEACFLRHLKVCKSDLEPKTFELKPRQVLVWHTRTRDGGHKGGDMGFEV